jgi:poly [ADP-ribose] polymerase
MSNILKQYKMNFFDISANSNKVWIGFAYDSGLFETRFGRVREGANLAVNQKQFSSGAAAIAELERKHHEKLRKGYRDTSVLDNHETIITNARPAELSKIAVAQIGGADDSITAELIKYLVDVNIHQITHSTSIRYDASNATFSTPLGVLTPDAVSDARNLIRQIETANSSGLTSSFRERLICDYYRLVPADFGVRIPSTNQLLDSADKIQKQISILDALEAALTTNAPTASSEKLFKTKLTKIPHFTDEGKNQFRDIRVMFEKSRNSSHVSNRLKLTRIYEVEIESMKTDFDRSAKKLGNIRADLWHGTKSSNLLSILKNGLIIPKSSSSHCTGRMFGDGIYTSLQSTKALNYATDFWNKSGGNNQRTFMFLCEVALGKTYNPKSYGESLPKKGTDSSWVEAGTAGVMNQECIVYDTAQINLKYLCEFGA